MRIACGTVSSSGRLFASTFRFRCAAALYPLHQTLDVGEAKEFECGTMSDEAPVCQIQRDEKGDIFVLIDGMKIAKRGQPDTAHADTWIMLEPGWLVRDVKGGNAIEVSYERARMH
jgi:hypothetical protein